MSSLHACWHNQSDAKPAHTLTKMLNASNYWQPDALCQWSDLKNNVGLGKAQLFNAAHSKKDKVFFDSLSGLAITANARIDNRNALARSLQLEESDPSITTDGQLILQCYIRWGRECPAHLRGDFVFVIWDQHRKKLFCARDHFGIKILFYSHSRAGVMVSNEHNAFFTSGWHEANSIDEEWLVKQLWGLGPKSLTSPCSGIAVLPPAHSLELDADGIKLSCYWHLKSKSHASRLSDEALIQELKRRFEAAVRVRTESEFPVGAELSEGLDSNGIVGFAAQHMQQTPLYTFSYDCLALDDENRHVWANTYADIEAMLAMHENIQPVWQADTENTIRGQQRDDKQAFYRAFGGIVPVRGVQARRARLARDRGIRVMLSGWGGDHCVTSYGDNYADELFRRGQLIRLSQLLRAKKFRGRGEAITSACLWLSLKKLMPKFHVFLRKSRPGVERASEQRARHHFLEKKWQKRFGLNTALANHHRVYQCQSVKQKEQLELFGLSLTKRLVESELIGRQFRLEFRFPMLDVDLVEFAHNLPSHLKIHEGVERYAFRRVLEGVTTKRIQWRIKADADYPNRDRTAETDCRIMRLRERLPSSKLMARFSSKMALNHCLEFRDRPLLDRLEFLLDVETHYFSAESPSMSKVETSIKEHSVLQNAHATEGSE